jgi:hypothetical protein
MKKWLIFFSLFIISCNVPNSPKIVSLREKINKQFKKLQQKYEVSINYYGNDNFNLPPLMPFTAASEISTEQEISALDKYLEEIFVVTINEYPQNFFKENKVKNIIIAKDVSIGSGPIRKHSSGGGFGVNFWGDTYVLISIPGNYLTSPAPQNTGFSPAKSPEDEKKDREDSIRILNHEIFHTIDYIFNNSEWDALNPSGQQYKGYVQGFIDNVYSEVFPPSDLTPDFLASLQRVQGFVSKYSLTDPREDRAEIFSWLLDKKSIMEIKKWITEGDKSLEKKVNFIKNYAKKRGLNPDFFDWSELGLDKENMSIAIANPEKIENINISESYNYPVLTEDHELNPVIGKAINLKSLKANSNKFKTIPDEFFKLTSLEEIDLNFNSLTELSPKIGSLKKLKVLKLGWNKIRKLPDEIYSLDNLEELDLTKLYLINVPADITNLQKVKKLNFSSNGLKEFPPDFFNKLTELEELDISDNYLEKIPDEIKKLTKLKKLYIESNILTDLPAVLFEMPSLQQVLFWDNQIPDSRIKEINDIFTGKNIKTEMEYPASN